MGMKVVEKQFFPDSNRPEILIDLWLPEGTSLPNTEALVKKVEERLLKPFPKQALSPLL
jgi:multidrug efflux pump